MLTVRQSGERGHSNHGWLDSRFSFSFADYYDVKHMHFGPLRVINEDYIAAQNGFGAHPHRDMEIITIVLEGSLTHQDSMGNKATIKPGEVQKMTAGTGVTHSERNDEKDGQTHLLQIWVIPDEMNLKPSYGQKSFADALASHKPVLVLSKTGRDGSIAIHQDTEIYLTNFQSGDTTDFAIGEGRGIWLQVIKGEVKANGQALKAGDAASLKDEAKLSLTASTASEFLVFDLPLF
ncbi:MAG: pirin family protein [Proteobacteria bacterium]|nr:MAG: pirin family protein [Pseudomonadota bacterium]